MRHYLKALSDAKVLDPLSIALVRRIICADPAHRETDEQQGALASWVLEAAIEELRRQGPAQAIDLEQERDKASGELLSLAKGLVFLCQATWVKAG
jgi:hypothetical protein